MPELQPSVPATPAPMPVVPVASAGLPDDPDYALGFECAVPALQIAQWGQEPRGESA